MNFSFEHRESDSPLVEFVWRTETEQAGQFISAANTQWEMVITRYQGKTSVTIRGPETEASTAHTPTGLECFGIVFRLGTYMPHLPLQQVMNRRDSTPSLASERSFWLNGAAWQIPDFENADTFVQRLTRTGILAHDPVVDAALRGFPSYVSPRTLQYRFVHVTGMTHNTIRQIERARQVAQRLQQGIPILDATFEAGYFDQAHLTRSLKRFLGQTPTQLTRFGLFG